MIVILAISISMFWLYRSARGAIFFYLFVSIIPGMFSQTIWTITCIYLKIISFVLIAYLSLKLGIVWIMVKEIKGKNKIVPLCLPLKEEEEM